MDTTNEYIVGEDRLNRIQDAFPDLYYRRLHLFIIEYNIRVRISFSLDIAILTGDFNNINTTAIEEIYLHFTEFLQKRKIPLEVPDIKTFTISLLQLLLLLSKKNSQIVTLDQELKGLSYKIFFYNQISSEKMRRKYHKMELTPTDIARLNEYIDTRYTDLISLLNEIDPEIGNKLYKLILAENLPEILTLPPINLEIVRRSIKYSDPSAENQPSINLLKFRTIFDKHFSKYQETIVSVES